VRLQQLLQADPALATELRRVLDQILTPADPAEQARVGTIIMTGSSHDSSTFTQISTQINQAPPLPRSPRLPRPRRQVPYRRLVAAMAWSTVSWMPKTFVSPVILKIFRIRSACHEDRYKILSGDQRSWGVESKS
jgi:hypothetical protein